MENMSINQTTLFRNGINNNKSTHVSLNPGLAPPHSVTVCRRSSRTTSRRTTQ